MSDAKEHWVEKDLTRAQPSGAIFKDDPKEEQRNGVMTFACLDPPEPFKTDNDHVLVVSIRDRFDEHFAYQCECGAIHESPKAYCPQCNYRAKYQCA